MSDDSATLRDAKAALIGLLGVLTFSSSLVPWCLLAVFKRTPLDALNTLSALSAGIVFGAFMVHMLPSAGEDFVAYLEHAYPADLRSAFEEKLVAYPWAPFVAGLVTALLVAVDRTIIQHGVHGDDGEHDHHHHDHISQAFVAMTAKVEEKAATAEGSPLVEGKGKGKGATAYGLVATSVSSSAEAHGHSHGDHGSGGHGHSHGGHGHSHGEEPREALAVAGAAEEVCPVVQDVAQRDAALRAWVFFVALSLHSVFDGLSLGGEESLTTFYGILVAVVRRLHRRFLCARFARQHPHPPPCPPPPRTHLPPFAARPQGV